MSNLKIITLSGIDNVGKNCHIIEAGQDIFVLDLGLSFMDDFDYGISCVLPDISYLEKNKKRIKALLISHAHLDHVGAIPYYLDKIGNPPIFGSPFTIKFISEKLKEVKRFNNAKLYYILPGKVVKINQNSFEFVHVTHSIPQSCAIYIKTPGGNVFYSGDYKFDNNPVNERPTDYDSIERISKEGILVSLLDSTNSFIKGFSNEEIKIAENLEAIMKEANGRVIISTFASLVNRIVGIVKTAKKLNKKVLLTGRSIKMNIKIAEEVGHLTLEKDIFISPRELTKYPDNQVVIVATGSQGEEMAALSKMAKSKHESIEIKKTDTIILASSTIPGNVLDIQKMLDTIARRGARIINAQLREIHVSGHAYQEDIKKMALMLKSKYYIPVHGYSSFLFQHKELLVSAGIPGSAIHVPSNGSIYNFKDGVIQFEKSLRLKEKYVLGTKLLDDKDSLLRDRVVMAENGFVNVAVIGISNRPSSRVIVTHRGVVNKERAEELTRSILQTVTEGLKILKSKKLNAEGIKKGLYITVGDYLNRRYGLVPLIAIEVE